MSEVNILQYELLRSKPVSDIVNMKCWAAATKR